MELRVLAFFLTLAGAQQGQLEGPENTLSVVGSNVTLKCISPSRNCHQIEWLKFVPDANDLYVFRDSVGIYGAFRARYSVDNSSGCHLVIKNVNLTDVGPFVCRTFIDSQQTQKAASLIILKDQPKCATNVSENSTRERDGVQLTCELTYNAITRASMVWNGVENAPAAVDNRGTISRSFSVVASAPVVPSFTCATSFAVETRVNGIAANIPVSTCRTAARKVLYSVRNMTLSPSSSYYSPGTIITCMAKGNPSPTLKWQENGSSGTWTDVQSETGTGFTRNEASDNRYRCHAVNVVGNGRYFATSHELQFKLTSSDAIGSVTDTSATSVNTSQLSLTYIADAGSTTENTPNSFPLTAVIGFGVGFVILLLIIVLVVCFCVKRCPGYKCCHSEKSKDATQESKSLSHQLNVTQPSTQRVGEQDMSRWN